MKKSLLYFAKNLSIFENTCLKLEYVNAWMSYGYGEESYILDGADDNSPLFPNGMNK